MIIFFLNLFFFNVFIPFFLSFIFSFFFIKYFIFFLCNLNVFQNIRIFIPKNHFFKKNIPTMGGISILFSFFFIFYIFFYKKYNFDILILILFFVLNSLIGFLDDYLKCFVKNSNGLSIFNKYILQSFFSFLYIYYLYYYSFLNINYYIYLFKYKLNISYIYILFWYFILVGTSNSVNFTDGLDGLVSFPLILNFIFLLIVSVSEYFLIFNNIIINYNYLIFINYLIIFISIILGSLLSFLYYNFYPAKIFLGDVGSLSLGFLLAAIFILLNKEFILFISGFVFFIEFISVILQIFWFNFLNKRIFLMAPLHHHYELLNYKEQNIVFFFWFLSFFSFLISLFIFFKFYV